MRNPRRVVTGHDETGRSVVVIDEQPNAMAGSLTEIWATESTPASNEGTADATDRPVRLNPPAAGSVFRFFQVGPAAASAEMSDAAIRDFVRERFAEMGAADVLVQSARHPAMHRTHTVDYVILLSGKVSLILDDSEIPLEPFDVVVQRGTSHSWANHGDEPALLAAVLIDAEPYPGLE